MKTQYFDSSEFACKCCGELPDENILFAFMKNLDLARGIAGIPFVINSGHRCPNHNKAVGGEINSAHLTIAADIKVYTSSARYKILDALIKAGFRRIGIARGFIHVDNDRAKLTKVIWVYGYE